jgi:hypothetical protein
MAFFLNQRQKRAVTYAKAGRCKFAHAALRDEVRLFDRKGSIPDSAFARAAKTVSSICGSALGGAKKKPSAKKSKGPTADLWIAKLKKAFGPAHSENADCGTVMKLISSAPPEARKHQDWDYFLDAAWRVCGDDGGQ